MQARVCAATLCALVLGVTRVSTADPVLFSTNPPDGLMAMASRPSSTGKIEIEAADDFDLPNTTEISGGTFTGLLAHGATLADISQVVLEIYRVFPADSTVPPSGSVPTRNNSPSDVEFASRDTAAGSLSFSTTVLNGNFTAANSVLNGINKSLTPATGGEGAVSGTEVQFTFTIPTPFVLPADHYFLVPQVKLNNGDFYWLSAPKPIVPPGTAFPPGVTDLQTWIRNANLDPDWLRVGTDIVDTVGVPTAPQFNAAFSLNGAAVPEPATLWTGTLGIAAAVGIWLRRRAARAG
jgi:hypothetical protein